MIPLQWVTATWFMGVCMLMGAPVPVVLIAGTLGYLLSPRYKTTTTESTKMTPEQKRIEQLERQLATQGETLDAIADAVGALYYATGYTYDDSVYRVLSRMKEKLDEMKENTL